MRIASLQPYLTDLIVFYGGASALCGVSHRCRVSGEAFHPKKVTEAGTRPSAPKTDEERLIAGLCVDKVSISALVDARPDLIVTRCEEADPIAFIAWAEEYLLKRAGQKIGIKHFPVETMQSLYATYEEVGELVGKGRVGRDLAQRTKAQIQDWVQNFYERSRNKKVTVLSSAQPLCLATGLVADLVKSMTGQPQERDEAKRALPFSWDEVVSFRSDVIIVAPCGASLEESVRALKILEAIPEWEAVPAVKRGEVVFCSGQSLYEPGPNFIRSAALVMSAMAALDSGYITEKDEYFRLRFLELHRHRFV